ncbi:MAG: hypothetical protein WCK51_07530 [Armatimonadota bacterium]
MNTSIIAVLSIAALALTGCSSEQQPATPYDANAKGQVIQEKPIYESPEARNAAIDADANIPATVKDAVKAGAGKLGAPGGPGAPSAPNAPAGAPSSGL